MMTQPVCRRGRFALRAIGVPGIKASARLTGACSHVSATATYILQFGSGVVGFCLEGVLVFYRQVISSVDGLF
jgi:hypothetical protein